MAIHQQYQHQKTATTPSQHQGPNIKLQAVGDDLRLPCFMNPNDVAELLQSVDSLRRSVTPFQSKHLPALKRSTWFVCRRPEDKTRSGLLCVWPQQQCCVYITGGQHHTRVFLLRLRVDTQFMTPGAGMTVFSASLSPRTRTLLLEDVWLWKGRPVLEEENFSERWNRVVQWMDHYCIADDRLMNGVRVDLASWQALDTVEPKGVWDFQCDYAGWRRLLWIAARREMVITPRPGAPVTDDIITHVGAPFTLQAPPVSQTTSVAEVGPLIAVGTKGLGGPDQWTLTSADGVVLGPALIRKMQVSTALREATTNVLRLEVGWNTDFGKWEVRSVATGTASHSSRFVAK